MTAFTRERYHVRGAALCAVLLLVLTLLLPGGALAETRYGRVTSSDVNLRINPSTTGAYLFKLQLNMVLPILETRRVGDVTWYRVQATDPAKEGSASSVGWIHGDYFYPLTQAEQTAWEKGQSIDGVRPSIGDRDNIEVVGASGRIANGGVNFRTQPTVKSYSLERLARGEVVELLSLPPDDSEDPWYKVRYDNQVGYIQGDFIRVINYGTPVVDVTPSPTPTEEPTPSPSPSPTVYDPDATPTPTQQVTATPTPTVTPYATPEDEQIIGYVKTTQDKVFLRLQPRNPGAGEPRNDIQQVNINTVLPYVAGPVQGTDNTYQWYYVLVGTVHGYLRGDCVTRCNADGTPIGTPTATPTASPTGQPQPTLTAAPTATAMPTGYVKTTVSRVWLRSSPNGNALEHIQAAGTVLTVTGSVQRAGGYSWYPVRLPNGHTGYVRSDCVVPCDAQGNTDSTVTPEPTAEPTAVPAGGGYIKTTVPKVWLRTAPAGTAISQVEVTGTVLAFSAAVRPAYSRYTWYYVTLADGANGYLRGDCVAECDQAGNISAVTAVPTAATPTPTRVTPSPTPTATITPEYTHYVKTTLNKVWVRRTPGGSALQLVEYRGTVLAYNYLANPTTSTSTWYHVRLSSGVEGFIRSDCVVECDANGNTIGDSTPTPTPTATPTGPVIILTPTPSPSPTPTGPVIWGYLRISKTNVAVRSTPGGDTVLGRLALGTFLTCRQAPIYLGGYNWYLCDTTYGTGYVRGDCVIEVDEHNATPTPGPTATPSPTPSPTPVATPTPAGNYAEYYRLKPGDTGTKVRELVTALKQQGYFTGTVTSTYTTAVANAVRRFNADHGLVDSKAYNDDWNSWAWPSTLHALYGTQPYPTGTVTELDIDLYPAEKVDWYTGDIQSIFPRGANAKVYDVYTGIVWWCHRWAGGPHADIEPLTAADTARLCQIYGVESAEDLEKYNLWERRPCLITIGNRTIACSLYGIGHNPDGDTISDNNFGGQVCLHFLNSRTTGTNRVDERHMAMIQYAWENAPNGHK